MQRWLQNASASMKLRRRLCPCAIGTFPVDVSYLTTVWRQYRLQPRVVLKAARVDVASSRPHLGRAGELCWFDAVRAGISMPAC